MAGIPQHGWASERQKQVLVLHATRRNAQMAIVADREMPPILSAGVSEGVDYYSEFIDRARFPNPKYQAGFRDFLQLKYSGHAFDLIIAIGDNPFDFIRQHRQMFGDVPVVYFASPRGRTAVPNETGFLVDTNLAGTITLAQALQPDLRNVFVVTGAPEDDRAFEVMARKQFARFTPGLTFTYLSGLPTDNLETTLSHLPPQSMVYYLSVGADGDNQYFHPLEYLDRITAVSNAPVYSWVDSTMGRGVLGGSFKVQLDEARAIANLGRRVLMGETVESIPVTSPDLNTVEVDWRQLRRWNIDESRVPPGTVIRFRTPSIWDRYRDYILLGVAVFAAETGAIAGLLLQHARRRRAEARIRDLGSRLLKAQETERSRIARELHDDISQQLAMLCIDLELIGRADDEYARDLAVDALRGAQLIARSIHDLSHRLHPSRLVLLGLVPAVRGLQRELSQPDVQISVTDEDVPASLPADLTLCLFRVVQEALHNAIRHGRAGHITVSLRGLDGSVALTVADDGVGFDVHRAWGNGLGLISMSERAEAVAGAIDIQSAPGRGTRVMMLVPVGTGEVGFDAAV